MYGLSAFSLIAHSLAGFFGAFGLLQLAGPRFLREAYEGWDYPAGLRVVTGLLDIAAAVMLASPEMRGWGIALAGLLTFGSVVTLLNHRQYLFAVPVVLMMVALVPAALAVPRVSQVQFVPAAVQLVADTQ